jgi:aryl-alcohol dehydrogenase-like predicted oxidoreductase
MNRFEVILGILVRSVQGGAMETGRIGSLEVTVVGLGCNDFGWRIDEEASARVVHAALEAGVNFFDTADIYGGTRSEEFLARARAAARRSGGRHEVRYGD